MPRRGRASRDNAIRSSHRLQNALAVERKFLGEKTGLTDTELQWVDDHFMNHQLTSVDPRMRTHCFRAEEAYRHGDVLLLVDHLTRLLRKDRAAWDTAYRTSYYEPAQPIIEKLKKKL